MNDIYFLHFKNITVYNANAISNAYILGLPSLTGFVGYGHVLARHLKTAFSPSVKVTGIAPIFHEIDLQISHPKYTNYQNDADPKKAASTIDERVAHFRADLIFRLEIPGDELAEEFKTLVRDKEFLMQFLYIQPLCGGQIKPDFSSSNLKLLNGKNEFYDNLKKVNSHSFLLEDCSALLTKASSNHKDNMDTLLDLIKLNKAVKPTDEVIKQKQEEKTTYRPYYIPVNIGFRSLEDKSKERKNARAVRHLYAEPVIGLARARTIASFRLTRGFDKMPDVFWNYNYNSIKQNLFLITAQ